MDVQKMHIGVNLGVQKVDSNAYDSLLPEEIDYYLNKAVDTFIKQKFEPRKNRLQLGFEQSIKRIEDIRSLLKTDEVDTEEVTQNLLSGIYIDKGAIPDDNFLLVSVGLKVFYNANGIEYTVNSGKRAPDGELDTDYGEMRVPAKFIQHDDIYAVLEDPFNKPKVRKGVFTIDGNDIYSYTTDKFITDKIVVTYVKQPATISLSNSTDCDLSESVHEDIVELAVKIILDDLGIRPQQE